MHTNKLNSRLKEMEVKLQPSEFSALGLTGDNHVSGRDGAKHNDINTLHGTYQYLKSTGQLENLYPDDLNNTGKSESTILFFTRGAKVGSESMLELLLALSKPNNLYIDRTGPKQPGKKEMPKPEQETLVKYINDLGNGSVYIHHVNWINFHEFQYPKPIFINLVRDPVERVISWYFYIRNSYRNAIEFRKHPEREIKPASWYKKDFNKCVRSGDPECQYVPFTINEYSGNFKRQSIFCCGHNKDCLPFDSPYAVQLAKYHVETEYAVVGTWEETNITLTVLENYIPRFFNNATEVFYSNYVQITNRNRNHRKPHIDDDVKAMIRKNFTNEYDFYYFCKQRLYKQYLALRPKEFFN
ncbi:heparan sulfate 2-O-sulfotransferase pipe isoform X2 [Teleopsis dalmanni]|uniref:heparan sulfate 2-O-sulfotransferase pipe isoform X2 n=1 Tax=Teleopsis dalmanni TaxID=139649 RepID=UPI0018CEFAC5|nr:heparan sulfate 2-O-sulfotransferase pipe isoform X2 [Teleopsis dalmanni]